jgi:hypothetical protein
MSREGICNVDVMNLKILMAKVIKMLPKNFKRILQVQSKGKQAIGLLSMIK